MKPRKADRHRSGRAPAAAATRESAAPPGERRRGAMQLLVLGVLVMAIQLAYLVDSRDEPTFWRPVVDAAVYDANARQIAAGTYTIATPFYHPPLFPYLLGWIYRLSGDSMLAAKVVLALIGAVTVMLTALIARRVMGWRASWVAGVMAALCGPLIFYNSQLLPAGLATMLNMLFLWLVLRASAARAPAAWWWAAGVAGGLAADNVPNILFVVPFVLAWLLWKNRTNAIARTVVIPGLWLLAGLATAILPVTLANYRNSQQFCLISYNGGLNFYIGNNLHAAETIAIRPGFAWETLDKLPVRGGVLRAVDQNSYYVDRTLDYLKAHPGHFVRGLLEKTRQITNARELPRNVDIYIFREWSVILAATVWRVGPFAFPFGIVFPLACLGMIIACRERRDAGLLALHAAAYAASVVFIFIASRYRVVLMPVLIVFAAYALEWLWERRRDMRRLALGALVVVAAGVWTNTPISAATDGIPFAAEVHNLLALQSLRDRDYTRAAAEVDTAIARAPSYAEAHVTRGMLEQVHGRLPEARDSFRKAIALKPRYPEAHDLLGVVLEQLGDAAGAEQAYRAALALSPDTDRLYKQLGALLFRQGRVAEAVPLLRRAIELDRVAPEARGMLAWILATCPDPAFRDGAQAVEQAMFLLRNQQSPDPTALDALAAGFAEGGDFTRAVAAQEQAIRMWRQAGREDGARMGEQRLALYQQRQPYRDLSLGRAAAGAEARRTR